MTSVEIGELIKKRREKLHLKQEDISEMIAITTKTIYLIENGLGNPSLNTLHKIATVLGLEIGIGIKKLEDEAYGV